MLGKKLIIALIALSTAASMLLLPIVTTVANDENSENIDRIDELLDEFREEFFSAAADEAANLEIIEIDTSRIIHVPQVYAEPEPPSLFAPFAAQPMTYSGPFEVGDTRDFRASTHVIGNYVQESTVKGELRGQGEHVNIWVLDCPDYHAKTGTVHNTNCHLNDIDEMLAQSIANDCDIIYKRMTEDFGAHAGVIIRPGSFVEPEVGDLGNDGKVNFLLYDIYGDGGEPYGGYVGGFFSTGDFWAYPGFNCLDMMHIDIGHNQGYNAFMPGAEIEDTLSVYSTLAHELQHLLFYMYFGVYFDSDMYDMYSWFNEALAELAGTYYVQQGAEVAGYSRLSMTTPNSYSNGSKYGDFLNFNNSFKSYGMGKLFSMLLYKTYGSDYIRNIYEQMKTELPPAQNNTQKNANTTKISNLGHNGTIGNFLHAATGIGDTPDDAFPLLYHMFMENFAADGGTIYGVEPVQSTKFYTSANPVDNLWSIRPVLGVANGIIPSLPNPTGNYVYFYSMTNSSYSVPTYVSGNTITLSGYGTQGAKPASHEMLYKLSGGGTSTPMLRITAPNDGNAATRYYVLIQKDQMKTYLSQIYSNGTSGADVYPLPKGVETTINTNGLPAYLYVVTLNQNVSSSAVYSWQAAPPEMLVGTVTLNNQNPRFGQTVTASVTPSGTYTYAWTANGENVGGNTTSYTTTENDIGKIIRVTVSQSGKTGEIAGQTVAVAKLAEPAAPSAPLLLSTTVNSITLQTVAGCEYSNGGLMWQDEPYFGNLLRDTEYKLYQRVKATSTREASASSPARTVRTAASQSVDLDVTVTTFEQLQNTIATYAAAEGDMTISAAANISMATNITIPPNPGGHTLTIKSDSTTRTLTRDFSDSAENNGLFMTSGGTDLIFENIIIDGNKSIHAYPYNKASLIRINSGGAVTMKDGTVLRNNSGNRGSAVYIDNGTLILEDGEITGNVAELEGGGVYIGGNITDFNELYLGGTAVIKNNTNSDNDNDNLYLSEDRYLIIGTGASGNGVAPPADGMEIWVTTETLGGIIVNEGASAGHTAYFRADEPGKDVVYGSGKIAVIAPFTGKYGDVNGDDRVNGTDVQAMILWVNAGYPAGRINERAGRITDTLGSPDAGDILALIQWINNGGKPNIGHPGPG